MASLTAIPLQLDPAGPTPLYHQIVQAIRWRIGTGVLAVGESLPSARRAAEEWGVNFHTVRQAYGELARQGLVESQVGSGTRVVSAGTAPGELRGFIEAFSTEAERRFGLGRAELAALLGRPAGSSEPDARVLLMECNTHQCTDARPAARGSLAGDGDTLGADPNRRAARSADRELLLSPERGPGRAGPVVSRSMHFAALQVDPRMVSDIAGLFSAGKVRHLTLCEQDTTTGRQMAADVSALLPGNPEIAVTTKSPVSVLRGRRRNELVLVAPRVWDRQGSEVRSNPGVLEVRYVFRPDHLEALGRALGASSA